MTTTEAYLHHKDFDQPWKINSLLVLGSDQKDLPFLSLTDPRHARIEKNESHYTLRDLRSSSGTFLNGSRIIEAFLQDGDLIEIGSHHFTFSLRSTENFKSPTKGLPTSKNEPWQTQLQSIPQIAQTHFPVLILGPSGSGKEILSEAIHKNSFRRNGPLMRVNCSALTETLIESELFGHIKGSFTGAVSDRKGAFEAARGGTLFLDEIGDLPYSLQAKLLRALENNEIRPVGSDRTIKTDVRIIAATHKDLKQKITEGEFRSDLYYRLNVIQLLAPSLKERMEDFEDLLFTFAREFRIRFSPGTIEKLKRHPWPGNIRELKNSVARASVLFAGKSIEESMLPRILDIIPCEETYLKSKPTNDLSVIKEIEREMIIKRLAANSGNQRQTARDLGMPKSTLHDKIRTYNINLSHFKK
jgi:DNA-binding NtrC family response regulator